MYVYIYMQHYATLCNTMQHYNTKNYCMHFKVYTCVCMCVNICIYAYIYIYIYRER